MTTQLQYYKQSQISHLQTTLDKQVSDINQVIDFIATQSYIFMNLKNGKLLLSQNNTQPQFIDQQIFNHKFIKIFISDTIICVGSDILDGIEVYSVKQYQIKDMLLKEKGIEKVQIKIQSVQMTEDMQHLVVFGEMKFYILNLKQTFLKIKNNNITIQLESQISLFQVFYNRYIIIQSENIQQILKISFQNQSFELINLPKLQMYKQITCVNKEIFGLTDQGVVQLNFTFQQQFINTKFTPKLIITSQNIESIHSIDGFLGITDNENFKIFDDSQLQIFQTTQLFTKLTFFQDTFLFLQLNFTITLFTKLSTHLIVHQLIKNNLVNHALKYNSSKDLVYSILAFQQFDQNKLKSAFESILLCLQHGFPIGLVVKKIYNNIIFLEQVLDHIYYQTNQTTIVNLFLCVLIKNQKFNEFTKLVRELEQGDFNPSLNIDNLLILCQETQQLSFLTKEIQFSLGSQMEAVKILVLQKQYNMVLNFLVCCEEQYLSTQILLQFGEELLQNSDWKLFQKVVLNLLTATPPSKLISLEQFYSNEDTFWCQVISYRSQKFPQIYPIDISIFFPIFENHIQQLTDIYKQVINQAISGILKITLSETSILTYFQLLILTKSDDEIVQQLQGISLFQELNYEQLLNLFINIQFVKCVIFCCQKLKFEVLLIQYYLLQGDIEQAIQVGEFKHKLELLKGCAKQDDYLQQLIQTVDFREFNQDLLINIILGENKHINYIQVQDLLQIHIKSDQISNQWQQEGQDPFEVLRNML